MEKRRARCPVRVMNEGEIPLVPPYFGEKLSDGPAAAYVACESWMLSVVARFASAAPPFTFSSASKGSVWM